MVLLVPVYERHGGHMALTLLAPHDVERGAAPPDCPYGSLPVWNFMLMNQCLLVL